MRDYYVILWLAETPSDVRSSSAEGSQALGRGPRWRQVLGEWERDDPTSPGTEFFADDVVVDFPSVQNAVARIRASVGMWELDGLWSSEMPLSSADAAE